MKKQIVKTSLAPNPVGPYNQAIIAGGLVYTAGQIALNPQTNTVLEGGVQEQTRQVMINLQAVLEAAGSDFSQVVKTTIFLQDMNDFAAVNAIYGEYFPTEAPARSTVEVSRLPKDVLVEIDCVALVAGR